MQIFFEVIKGFFFFATILIGLLFLRWEVILGMKYFLIAKQMLLPGYLVFAGIMIGYILSQLSSSEEKETISIKSFIVGISIGVILAIIYMFIQ
jgi:hypothetical protein